MAWSPRWARPHHTWSNLIAGKNGAARVENFEVSDLAAQIACQIKRGDGTDGTFNPDLTMEPKEQRKVDDFIIYAMAAADEALACTGNNLQDGRGFFLWGNRKA